MGVPTNAALATLTVSKADFEKDKLLQWVCHLASPLQLTVQQQPKACPLQLEAQNTIIDQRNTILRTLCGMGLHKALDQAPWYLLGGGTSGPLSMGLTVQWMSTADSLRTKTETPDTVCQELQDVLTRQSFLIGSAQASLADFDVALQLVGADDCVAAYPAVARWRETVLWNFAATAPPHIAVDVSSSSISTEPAAAPMFYDGTEDDWEALLAPPAPKKAAAGGDKGQAGGGGGGGGKQQQKQQQQQPQGKQGGKKQEKQAKGGGAAKGGGGGGQQQQAPDSYDISALDIRVGKIVKAWHHEESDKLFCEDVDLGTETRQIASGLRAFYKTEDLQDRLVLVLCNLKKRNLAGFPSHGMVLCASNADHTAVEFVVPPEGSKLGERVQFEGFSGDPEPENKVAKKKVFEKLAPDLKTDAAGNVVWKTATAKTDVGVVRAVNGMANATVA